MANRRLVRQLRRWQRAGLGGLAGIAVLVIGGAAANHIPATIEANEFVLRDRDGTMRAALAMRPDGTPGLGLFDEQGQVRLSVELNADGSPGLNIHDEIGILPRGRGDTTGRDTRHRPLRSSRTSAASLDVGNDGTSGVNVYDNAGALRAAVAMRPDGTPGVGLFDPTGMVQQELEPGPDLVIGNPELE